MASETAAQKQQRDRREVFQRWKSEIDFAAKDNKYTDWLERCDKVIRRYRDERKDALEQSQRRLNILWSNVQTMRPAVYGKMPKPIVERRYMDRDPVARIASMVLERTVSFQMEVGYFHASTKKAVLDYLLPGMGQIWVRYEPQIESAVEGAENTEVQREEGKSAEEIAEEGDGIPYETVAYEKGCVDYVYFKDFIWSPARCWEEVRWVAKRSYLTHSEIAERFFQGDLAQAKKITLDYTPDRLSNTNTDEKDIDYFKKACVWEIWNKADRKVYFLAPGTPEIGLLETRDDPLHLECFWPCPEPLFTTLTNDSLIPVPDHVEYQDQAKEIDDLTNRIDKLTKAIKAAGVYDASQPALARLLEEGSDNKLIPVDSWAAFAEKGGVEGAVSMLPVKDLVEVLLQLYNARAQVKQDLYEVTGISDIIRGQGGSQSKTATEQRIKGQFATLRLQDRQEAVAQFCRDGLHILAEIVSEHFSEESLMLMSGYQQIVQDEIRKAAESVPPPQPPQLPEGTPPEQAQMIQQQVMAQHQQAVQKAQQQAEQKALGEFAEAIKLLRSDKLRGFRIDIETDSTIQVDAQADKEAATELVATTFQGLGNAAPLIAQAPELIDPIGNLLMFAFRRFRVGRSIESSLEDALDQIRERMKGPKPPSPEQMKAEGEQKKLQAEMQRDQANAQMELKGKQMDLQMKQAEHQMKMEQMQAEMALKAEELRLKEQEIALKEREMGMKALLSERQAAIDVRKTEITADANERQHELGMEALEAKTAAQKEAAKAKPDGAKK